MRGGESMSEREKKIAEKLAQTISALPPEKQQYILGYAEGAADIAAAQRGGTGAQQPEAR